MGNRVTQMPGVTIGPVAVLSLDPPRLELPPRVFTVPNPAAQRDVKVGDQVTVVWEELADTVCVVGLIPAVTRFRRTSAGSAS